jgi:hypothetical protein
MSQAIKKIKATVQCCFENCGRQLAVEIDYPEEVLHWELSVIDQARTEFWHLCDHPRCKDKLFCFEHGDGGRHESHSFDPEDIEEEASEVEDDPEVENEEAQGGNQEAQAVKAA